MYGAKLAVETVPLEMVFQRQVTSGWPICLHAVLALLRSKPGYTEKEATLCVIVLISTKI